MPDALRPYQLLAVEACYEHLREKDSNPCIVIPTGGGKTHVIARICSDAAKLWEGRICLLAHRKELLEQSAEKIERYAEGLKVGIYSAGIGRRDTRESVIIAGIQSVYEKATELGRFDLILIDEAHRIPPDGEGMYRQFLLESKAVNPQVRVIGLTATPYRMGTGPICTKENILHEVCYECGVKELIHDGYLSKLTSKTGKSESIADLSQVHVRAGEFVEHEMEAAFSEEGIVAAAVREVIEYARERKKVLIFSCGVKHAEVIVGALRKNGAEGGVGLITGEMPMDERERVLESFRSGDLKFLVNIFVLTEGFDAPNIDLIALMRATKSPGLYYQMVGRGLRTCPGKTDCIILDFGDNVLRHGPIDKVRPRKDQAGNGDGEAPVKACPECRELVPTAMARCPACGHEFPPRPILNHDRHAGEAPVLSMPDRVEWHEVESIGYSEHVKRNAPPGAPKTLRVTYTISFMLQFSEWICVEHPDGSFPALKALAWWRTRTTVPMPADAAQAAWAASNGLLRCPRRIQVQRSYSGNELPRIVGVEFEDLLDEYMEKREPELSAMARAAQDPDKTWWPPSEEVPF